MEPRIIGHASKARKLFGFNEGNRGIVSVSSDISGRYIYGLTTATEEPIYVYDSAKQTATAPYQFTPLSSEAHGIRIALQEFVDGGLAYLYCRYREYYTMSVVRIDHEQRLVAELAQLVAHAAIDTDDDGRLKLPQLVYQQHIALIVREDQPLVYSLFCVDALRRTTTVHQISLPFEAQGGVYIHNNKLHLIRSMGFVRLAEIALVDLSTFDVTTAQMKVIETEKTKKFCFPELSTDPCIECGSHLVGIRIPAGELLAMDLTSLQWRVLPFRIGDAQMQMTKLLLNKTEAASNRLLIYQETDDNEASLTEFWCNVPSLHTIALRSLAENNR